MKKKHIGINVFRASQKRIEWVFDNFPKIYVSFSGGKDSTVMTHLVLEEARKRNVKVGLLFIDFEAQYKLTIDHICEIYEEYKKNIIPFWVALPIHLRNSVSQYEPHWVTWEPTREKDWVRKPPTIAITDQKYFPFYEYAMEFEEFVPEFGKWYSGGEPIACFVGIRTAESLNRWRTIAGGKKTSYDNKCWTTWIGDGLWNVYPIYDWRAKDIWIYCGKTGKSYNKLYDYMYKAGLTLHQMRICQPYGDDQRKGLWLFHLIEPETWGKIVARVNGANQGALYAKENGNILGNIKISKPEGHTWESFAMMLLDSMPEKTSDHFKNKIAVFIKWYEKKGIDTIPDDGPLDKSQPSWKRIVKVLLRNDYWCKGLSFSQHKSKAYNKYTKLMKKKREEWRIMQ